MTDQTESDYCKHGTPNDPNWACFQCGDEALRQSADADYSAIGSTATQPESDNAALLRDLDSAAAGIQRLDRLDAESAAKAIRGLEAKVREVERQRDTHYVAKPFYNSIEKQLYDVCADRDRLAGEVERLKARHEYARKFDSLDVAQAEVARLTSELAAAREDAVRVDALQSMLRSVDFDFEQTGESVLMFTLPAGTRVGMNLRAAIDAARRAGEGEVKP